MDPRIPPVNFRTSNSQDLSIQESRKWPVEERCFLVAADLFVKKDPSMKSGYLKDVAELLKRTTSSVMTQRSYLRKNLPAIVKKAKEIFESIRGSIDQCPVESEFRQIQLKKIYERICRFFSENRATLLEFIKISKLSAQSKERCCYKSWSIREYFFLIFAREFFKKKSFSIYREEVATLTNRALGDVRSRLSSLRKCSLDVSNETGALFESIITKNQEKLKNRCRALNLTDYYQVFSKTIISNEALENRLDRVINEEELQSLKKECKNLIRSLKMPDNREVLGNKRPREREVHADWDGSSSSEALLLMELSNNRTESEISSSTLSILLVNDDCVEPPPIKRPRIEQRNVSIKYWNDEERYFLMFARFFFEQKYSDLEKVRYIKEVALVLNQEPKKVRWLMDRLKKANKEEWGKFRSRFLEIIKKYPLNDLSACYTIFCEIVPKIEKSDNNRIIFKEESLALIEKAFKDKLPSPVEPVNWIWYQKTNLDLQQSLL